MVHTQPFKFGDCDKCFASKRNLKGHQHEHMGIKIQCEICHSDLAQKVA